jgi:iron complex transport system ATP-binding protein
MSNAATVLLAASDLCLQTSGAVLLDNVSVQISAGEVLGVIGPNGAGKSSLLKLLAGVCAPTSGVIRMGNKPLADYSATLKAQTIAYLEQRPHVYWPLTVSQVVGLGRLPHAADADTASSAAVRAALDFTGIANFADRRFNTLSEGEKMLVNISRVLATQPRIILADEPTAALDPYHQLMVMELLRTLAGQNRGILVVMHDLNLAARFCDRLLLLAQGRIVSEGEPAVVLDARHIAQAYHVDAVYDPIAKTVTTKGRSDACSQ